MVHRIYPKKNTVLKIFFHLLFGTILFSLNNTNVSSKTTEIEDLSTELNREIEILKSELAAVHDTVKHPFKMPASIKFCDGYINLEDPFIYRRVKKEINEIVFHEGQLGNLVDLKGEFFPIIEPILAAHNVPDDLKYLVAVESNFKIKAASYAGAKGPWQFIKSSAKRCGLKLNSNYDERYNLKLATEAAVKHLTASYRLFGDWLLAITAYNKGDKGVNNILNIQGIDLSPEEDENPEEQSGNGPYPTNGELEKSKNNNAGDHINGQSTLENYMAEQRDSNFWDLVLLVKIVRRGRVIGYRNEQERYVPRVIAMKLILENAYNSDFLKFHPANQLEPIPSDTVKTARTIAALDVAKTLGISLWNLKHLNPQYKGLYPIIPAHREFYLPSGLGPAFEEKQNLIKTHKSASKSSSRKSSKSSRSKHSGELPKSVKLQPGETLWDISRRYGVSMKTILRLNGITYQSARYLRPGKRIVLH